MGPVLQGILQTSFLVKMIGTRKTVGLRDDRVSYTFNRSARNQLDEEFTRLPEHTIDRLSGSVVQRTYDPRVMLERMERVGEAR